MMKGKSRPVLMKSERGHSSCLALHRACLVDFVAIEEFIRSFGIMKFGSQEAIATLRFWG